MDGGLDDYGGSNTPWARAPANININLSGNSNAFLVDATFVNVHVYVYNQGKFEAKIES